MSEMSGSGGSSSGGGVGGTGTGGWPLFTVAQWQELEHQALIFKYLKAGLPVPPDLLVPIQRSLASMSSRFLQYPTLGYYSFYGKKVDPEPGRCRRTDGKKWRCSKDAHPDSKYCERHMNRGRYRSRKPVESQTTSQSLSTAALDIGSGSSSGRNFPNLPLHSMINPVSTSYGSSLSQLQVEYAPYGSYSKYSELKPESDVHKSPAETSASVRGFEMKSMVDAHNAMSQAPADLPMGWRKETSYQGDYSQLQKLQEYGRIPDDVGVSKQQKQHYFFGMDFSSQGPGKPEHQSVQPFFDEWPETRDSSSYADNQRSNLSSYPSAQLSISIDKVPSEIHARGAQSPTDRRGSMCNFQA